MARQPPGTPAQWAEQSFRLAKEALVTPDTNIDEGYYRRHIGVIDERLALGGVRLAAVLNRMLMSVRRCTQVRLEAGRYSDRKRIHRIDARGLARRHEARGQRDRDRAPR